ncbi:Aldo/keto reductase [Coniochaeta ligniaria NRRL 30616]|uniref:Aldo/keto reductase n=1 Tax=Coniochaeta ligniaria NRRL 30616 TaxID=1408157 RepID=A0A1J7IFL7_9PEZI|nr:Aldo/keto reductase [Coniochaeta ligniaria NRRL 30616]
MTAFMPDDTFLQRGLAAGMSATSGFHSSKPSPVSPDLAGKNILPQSVVPSPTDRIEFKTAKGPPVKTSPICIGAWPWGDKGTWHWTEDELPNVKAAWKYLYESGINFIDTAAVYGDGRSEEIVGELVRGLPRDSVVVQTKWLGLPTAAENYVHPVDAPVIECKKSLARLGLDYVDVYMVHGPIHPQSIKNVAKGLAKLVDQGLARAVAVANYDTADVKKMEAALAEHGVPLAAQQVEYNVLRRLPETTGQIAECRQRGIVFQTYSSLAQGRLSGKYSADNPPPKTYRFSKYDMKDVEPTLQVLRGIAQKRGKSVASVSLNWVVSEGGLPLVGIRNEQQAKDAVEALGWRLTEEEVDQCILMCSKCVIRPTVHKGEAS